MPLARDTMLTERSLHAAFRLRLASVASSIAWITIAALLLVIVLQHRDDGPLHLVGLSGLLGVAALANLFTYSRSWRRIVEDATSAWPFYVWTGLLLLFNTAMVLLAGSEPAEIYLIYIPVVLFAAAALAFWAVLSTIAVTMLSYVGTLWLAESDLGTEDLALRAGALLVVGLLGAYLAAEQRREVTERARREAQAVKQSHDLQILHDEAVGLASELRATVDALQDGMVTIDTDLRITALNPAAERLLGWSASEAVGQSCASLLDPIDSQGISVCREHCPALVMGEGGSPSAAAQRLLIRRRDGQRVACTMRSGVKAGAGGAVRGYLHTIRDMTEDERRQEEILRANRDLRIMISTGERASQSLDPDTMLSDVLSTLLEVTELTGAAVFVADAPGGDPTLQVSRGHFSDGVADGIDVAIETIRTGQAVSRPLCPAQDHTSPEAGDGDTWALGVPLGGKPRTTGALALAFPPGVRPTSDQAALLGAVAGQLGVALENALLYEELQQKGKLRSELLAKVISAEEDERKRIARDLHDEAIQSLSAVLAQLGAVEQRLPVRAKAREHIADVRNLMKRAIGEVRKAILGLRPSALDDLGLVPALRSVAGERLEEAGITLRWDASGLSRRLPPEMETALFRIVQEAVNNIVRHAQAETVTIEFRESEGAIVAEVEDDGVGFDVARLTGRRSGEAGLGLLGMRERASRFGGSVDVQSAPGQGTRLHIELPCPDDGGAE
jgi:PAS domain S-box-containing protein